MTRRSVLIEKDGKSKPIFEKAWEATTQFECGKLIDIEGKLFPCYQCLKGGYDVCTKSGYRSPAF